MNKNIERPWNNMVFVPSGKPYDYSAREYVEVEPLAEEVARITGSDPLKVLQVIICECQIVSEWRLEDTRQEAVSGDIAELTGIPVKDVRRVLDGMANVMWRIGTATKEKRIAE